MDVYKIVYDNVHESVIDGQTPANALERWIFKDENRRHMTGSIFAVGDRISMSIELVAVNMTAAEYRKQHVKDS